MNPMHEKIVQITAAADAENGEVLYALDSQGNVWERVFDAPPRQYVRHPSLAVDLSKGVTETHSFIAGCSAGWRKVSMVESKPVYHAEDPRRGLPQE